MPGVGNPFGQICVRDVTVISLLDQYWLNLTSWSARRWSIWRFFQLWKQPTIFLLTDNRIVLHYINYAFLRRQENAIFILLLYPGRSDGASYIFDVFTAGHKEWRVVGFRCWDEQWEIWLVGRDCSDGPSISYLGCAGERKNTLGVSQESGVPRPLCMWHCCYPCLLVWWISSFISCINHGSYKLLIPFSECHALRLLQPLYE